VCVCVYLCTCGLDLSASAKSQHGCTLQRKLAREQLTDSCSAGVHNRNLLVTADNTAEDCQQSIRQRISRLRPRRLVSDYTLPVDLSLLVGKFTIILVIFIVSNITE